MIEFGLVVMLLVVGTLWIVIGGEGDDDDQVG